MEIELKLSKPDDDALWGFRLTGGCEFDVPITVVKVTEDSIAANSGIQVGDMFEKINEIYTSELTHNDVHNILLSAGNNLNLIIRREDNPIIDTEEISGEISQYLQEPVSIEDYELEVNKQNEKNLKKTLAEMKNVQQGGVQHILVQSQAALSKSDQRKWSTFLQRPANPIPLKKKEDDIPPSAPYRVIIKKQKKKSAETSLMSEDVSNKEANEDANAENVEENNETIASNIENEEDCLSQHDETENNSDHEVLKETIPEEDNEEKIDSNKDDISENIERENTEGQEDVCDESLSKKKLLEEKLAAIQRQLELLSQLPTDIQDTLDMVSNQLASIVKEEIGKEEDVKSQCSEATMAENDITNFEANDEEIDGNENITDGEIINYSMENLDCENENELKSNADIEQETEVQPEETIEEESEEEKEAKRIQEEQLRKQEKHRPSPPLKPIDRPIILPGGRRWSQPEDACPAVRHPKMSDEKIANTIETYSEVIVGKLKGINFLKYQLPPKNMDFLQKSEAYRLIHDLEPPLRGVGSRAHKILAAEDYYDETKEVSQ